MTRKEMILSACPRGKAKQWASWYLCASEMERARCRSLYNTPAVQILIYHTLFFGPPAPRGHASNLVGPVRDIIELLGGRRLFQAVRHIGPKWATCTTSCTPSVPGGPHGP